MYVHGTPPIHKHPLQVEVCDKSFISPGPDSIGQKILTNILIKTLIKIGTCLLYKFDFGGDFHEDFSEDFFPIDLNQAPDLFV